LSKKCVVVEKKGKKKPLLKKKKSRVFLKGNRKRYSWKKKVKNNAEYSEGVFKMNWYKSKNQRSFKQFLHINQQNLMTDNSVLE